MSDVLDDLRAAVEVANAELRRLALLRPDLIVAPSVGHGPDDAPYVRVEVTARLAVIGGAG